MNTKSRLKKLENFRTNTLVVVVAKTCDIELAKLGLEEDDSRRKLIFVVTGVSERETKRLTW